VFNLFRIISPPAHPSPRPDRLVENYVIVFQSF
jgi:hypothetical protein